MRLPSSSDDSVSSWLSESEFSGFSYCNNRSKRNDRSRVTLSKRRWLERKASWKYSFSWKSKYVYVESIQSNLVYAMAYNHLRKGEISVSFSMLNIAFYNQLEASFVLLEGLDCRPNRLPHLVHYLRRDHYFGRNFDLPLTYSTNRTAFSFHLINFVWFFEANF